MARVGPYLLTETLGQGTFGKVKLAIHKDSREEFAIKILNKSDIQDNDLTSNVRQEIAIMKALHHPNIVNLREVLSSKNKLYMVMDLVRGGELFDMIERRGELDEKTARKYFQQLVDGVDYCHRRGVFHRDLKPENLLVDENGVLKITDFGVSSVKSNKGAILHTACGTPYYCAPEILATEGYNGEKVDAWSCGVILYLLLTGDLPFKHDEMGQLYELVKQCRVVYPSSLSSGAKDVLSKILVRDPERRYTLPDVKRHPWFRVDYNPTGSFTKGSGDHDFGDEHRIQHNGSMKGGQMRGPGSTLSHTSSNPSMEGNGSTNGINRVPSGPRIQHGGGSGGRQGFPNVPSNHGDDTSQRSGGSYNNLPAPVVNVTEQYEGKNVIDFVKDAMPGKPAEKIQSIVSQLSDQDIDCIEDLQAVAEQSREHEQFRQWLQNEASLPQVKVPT